MDIFELEKEKRILELNKFKKNEQINIYKSKLDVRAIDYQKPAIQSSPLHDAELDIFHKISELENDVVFLNRELEIINNSISKLYDVFKEYKDEEKQIYIEKRLYRWSNAKISTKHDGISKWKINRVIRKIRESI